MSFSSPVSFTHVYLLMWRWVCEDNGQWGGFQRLYRHTDSKVHGQGLAQDVSVQGGWQCYSLPSVSQAAVQQRYVEGIGSSPPCHTTGIAAFDINITVCAGLLCLFVEEKWVQAAHRYIKKAPLHSDCPSVYRLSVFHVCDTLSYQRRTGTVTVSSTLLSYKVTKCPRRMQQIEIIELVLFVLCIHLSLKP